MSDYLTQDDVTNYGSDLLNLTQRAALHVVAPHLQNLEAQNAELRQQLAREARHNLDAAVERAIPNYREVDRDPRWHEFLRGVDPFTGQQKQALLNIAIADGSASRVIAIFKGFLQEAGGTQAYSGQAPAGRTRSSGRPVYTPQQIAEFYSQHRRGLWAGREDQWARLEADFFAAQRENRVAGLPYLTK
jgi:hypothetical protein